MGPPLHIVADENIALVEDFFSPFGKITRLRGNAIKPSVLHDADVLLVRSVTPVNDYLLRECPRLHFLGSATSGIDHVDVALLNDRRIHFASAPGSNATSVAEYVLAGALVWDKGLERLKGKRIGIVGMGMIGSRVADVFSALGCSVIANDPPLLSAGGRFGDKISAVDLDELLASSDVITVHVPLTVDGRWPTSNLIDAKRAGLVRHGSMFVNTSRGEIVTPGALELLQSATDCALDVWPNEPTPDTSYVDAAFLATPHIAGYSLDAKIRGTRMLRDALKRFLGTHDVVDFVPNLSTGIREVLPVGDGFDEFASAVLSMCPIREDDARFRSEYLRADYAARGAVFRDLRKNYPIRRSIKAHEDQWIGLTDPTTRLLKKVTDLLVAE